MVRARTHGFVRFARDGFLTLLGGRTPNSVRAWLFKQLGDRVTAGRTDQKPARSHSQWDDLWRPSQWLVAPTSPQPVGIHLAAIIALVLYANVIVNEVLSPPWYVPFNLAVLGVVMFIARRAGTTDEALGVGRRHLQRGLIVGGLIALVLVALLAAAVAIPDTRDAFRDDRIVEGSAGLSLYHALFRVPIGTALYEEILFRGVVFGMLARRTSALAAAAWSSLLFGLWHVLPALDAIETNPIGDAFGATWTPVVAAVVSTFLAGLFFVWVRLFAGSIVAPIIVHVSSNSTAILAATFVVHVL